MNEPRYLHLFTFKFNLFQRNHTKIFVEAYTDSSVLREKLYNKNGNKIPEKLSYIIRLILNHNIFQVKVCLI